MTTEKSKIYLNSKDPNYRPESRLDRRRELDYLATRRNVQVIEQLHLAQVACVSGGDFPGEEPGAPPRADLKGVQCNAWCIAIA